MGIAVSGRPIEMRRCDNARREYDSAPTKKRYASREFHSSQVVRRHSCTTVETSDSLFVYLCGFINRSRTQQSGFSSEVCRDFIYGFPINWEDYAAKCVTGESSHSNDDYLPESLVPAALDAYNGAQLHDMVLSLSDAEREILNKKMYDNVMGMVNPEIVNEITVSPSKRNPSSSFIDKDIVTPNSTMTKAKSKRRLSCSPHNYNEQEVVESVTSRKRVCRTAKKHKSLGTEESVTISPKASVKQGPEKTPARNMQTSRKRGCASVTKPNNARIEKNEKFSAKDSVKEGDVDEQTRAIQTSRGHLCKGVTNLRKFHTRENDSGSPKAKASIEQRTLRAAKRNQLVADSTQAKGQANVEKKTAYDQSEVRQLLERLTSVGKRCRLLKELLY